MNILIELLQSAKGIYQAEGFLSLAKRASAFAAGWLFKYENYYLYENDGSTDRKRIESDIVPKVDGLTFRVICTNEEADELEAQGFQFRRYVFNARNKLDRGAMAFCIFIGHELANIGWLCTTQQAKDSLNEPPARVDCSKNEVWAGGSWTNPKYRRIGLYRYCSLKQVEYWLQRGMAKDKWAVAKRNVAPLTAESITGHVRYAEGRLVKVLWWKSWKETPLKDENLGEEAKRDVPTI